MLLRGHQTMHSISIFFPHSCRKEINKEESLSGGLMAIRGLSELVGEDDNAARVVVAAREQVYRSS